MKERRDVQGGESQILTLIVYYSSRSWVVGDCVLPGRERSQQELRCYPCCLPSHGHHHRYYWNSCKQSVMFLYRISFFKFPILPSTSLCL